MQATGAHQVIIHFLHGLQYFQVTYYRWEGPEQRGRKGSNPRCCPSLLVDQGGKGCYQPL